MTQVTITDTIDVGEMETDTIRHWISLHKRSLKDKEMTEHWKKIKVDLIVLQAEYDLRKPEAIAVQSVNETLLSFTETINQTLLSLNETLKSICNEIKILKGEEDGKKTGSSRKN